MAISTDSIIHYTKKLETLQSILREGFKIKYCYEILELGVGVSRSAHPMVSFCDIPLSNAKEHYKSYGKYAIGLTKKWASEKKINPVLYIDKHSLVAETILDLIKSNPQVTRIQEIKSHSKNYSMKLKEENNFINYICYKEREWRFIPAKEDKEFSKYKSAISVKGDEYLLKKEQYNKQISGYRLSFSPKDISYIIVESTSEIPEIVSFLSREYRKKCTAEELDILFSKVCSTEQIEADY